MRNKAPLAMLEQLVMLLVFALAAALCLQAFALADRISDRTERFDRAVLEAQQAAETVKHCRGDLQQAQALLGGSTTETAWTVEMTEATVTVTPQDSGHPLLGSAAVTSTEPDGTVLYSVTVFWQKEGSA